MLAQAERTALLERIAFLGARPFQDQVVQTPWSTVIDAPSLHRSVKELIARTIQACGQSQAIRCLTFIANAGYGKTHLLAWTRQMVEGEKDNRAVFVYVSPYAAGELLSLSLEQHVFRAVVDALWLRSRRQQALCEYALRALLVESYDRILDSGHGKRLRVGTIWSRLFWRSRLHIAARGPQDQIAALQRALTRRFFLEETFAEFSRQQPVGPDGTRLDWDAFVAACLMTCGDTRQRWHADRWFRGERLPADVLAPFHLDQPCQGMEKIRNGLFTLQRLVNQSFCLAFDQIEDTYLLAGKAGSPEAARFAQLLGILLRNLCAMPGFCLLFACQQSVWQDFLRAAPTMLLDRMAEGHGIQALQVLDDDAACDLVRCRLNAAVWSQLCDGGPPAEEPCFPFTEAEIRRFRIDMGGEPRPFLQLVQQEYDRRVVHRPKQPRPIELHDIKPREVVAHEPTPLLIRGDNFPAEVRVLFNGQPAPTPPICRPADGEIDVTTPTELHGEIEVRVEETADAENGASLPLRFLARPLPRPYARSIDPLKLRDRRVELHLTQAKVAERVGTLQPYISRLETGKWANAPDDLFVNLAELYDKPLSYFQKSGRTKA
jgi:DNA-binding XRE family transcriptional regulator